MLDTTRILSLIPAGIVVEWTPLNTATMNMANRPSIIENQGLFSFTPEGVLYLMLTRTRQIKSTISRNSDAITIAAVKISQRRCR